MKRIFALVLTALLLAGLIGVQPGAANQFASSSPEMPQVTTAAASKLNDLKLRQAIAYCTDKAALVRSVYPLLTTTEVNAMVRDSFIPAGHWAYQSPSTQYPYDPAAGKALLVSAGWTEPSPGAFRKNAAGEELALKFTTTTATFRQTWAAAFENQMAACGIRIVRFHVPSAWWFGDDTGLVRRDFELGAFAWVGGTDPGGQTLYACDQIPSAANGWQGQNYMGWCNSTASDAIKAANNTLNKADRITAYATVQEEFGKDAPSVPLFTRTESYAYNNAFTGISPVQGQQMYSHNAYQWARSGRTTLKWGMTQEPASLFGLVEGSWVANLVLAAVEGLPYTTPNYNPQPYLQDGFATLENGQAQNNTVSVGAGVKVLDANGSIVTLANGVQVRDASGNLVTFSGTPINMKQLVVPYTFLSNLKWPDNTLVVQEDFQLGYDISCNHATGATSYITCDRIQTFAADAHGYHITWLPGYQSSDYYQAPFRYYPAHRPITSGVHAGKTLSQVPAQDWDIISEISEKPWGAGPYFVSNWVKTQYIELSANPYFALGAPATPTIRAVFITPESIETNLIGDTVDLVGAEALPGMTTNLLNASNLTRSNIASGTYEHVDINIDKYVPAVNPLMSLSVRRAIAYCTDKAALVRSVYPLLSTADVNAMLRDSFIPTDHWAYQSPSTQYPYNPAAGKALLVSAGWTEPSPGAFRKNATGEVLALKFTTTNAAFRQMWGSVFENQMRACGIQVLRLHAPSAWWFGDTTGLVRRDFELGAFAWVGQYDPGGSTLYACDQIPSAANGWEGQNYMGWCNPTASNAIKAANNTLIKADRITAYGTVQEELGKDIPSLPLFTRTEVYAYNNALTGFSPAQGESNYSHSAYQWARSGHTTLKWGMTQEPASLFGLASNMWVSSLVLAAVEGLPYTTPNYNPQPYLQDGFATLENGQAQNNTVSVGAGAKVIDANGSIVTLANGVQVRDAGGSLVTFSGTPVSMKQLVVPYTFLSNLKWPDNTLVVQEDFQLGYEISCNTATGATSYFTCDRIQTFSADAHGYHITWLPGYQSSDYSFAPFRYYPAHRAITSGVHAGKTLSQVPAQDWKLLREVAEIPWGAGPYYVSSWVKTQYIELSANPYFALGTPATSTIRVVFTTPETIEANLIGDTIDLVGSDALAGITTNLNNASNLTKISLPSATWEHIDLNLGEPSDYSTVIAAPPSGLVQATINTSSGQVSGSLTGVTSGGTLTVTVDPNLANQPAYKTLILPAFNITTSGGLTFSTMTITLPYNEADVLQAGLIESKLKLYHYQGGAWVDVTTAVDTVHNTISGTVTSLSPFLIGANTIQKIYLPAVGK